MRTADSFDAEYARKAEAIQQSTDQFRASLDRHIDALIEEEQVIARTNDESFLVHEYAASLLRELRAWIETGS